MDIKRVIRILIISALMFTIFYLAVKREKTGRLQRLNKDDHVESYAPSGPIEDSTVPTQVTGKVYVIPKEESR